jgi:tight adherence protein B
MVGGLYFPKIRTSQIITKRRAALTTQFKDMLYSLSSALSVGKSVEIGLRDALNDLAVIYPNPQTDIIVELSFIVRGLSMNETVENMFRQFAGRAHIGEIDNFVDVFTTCKRTGGDLMEIIRSTSAVIGDKIEVKQEISTLIAGKKFEFNILMVMPVVLVFLLTYSSGGYMEPVFVTLAGRVIMTLAIGIFVVAYLVGSKVMKIEI